MRCRRCTPKLLPSAPVDMRFEEPRILRCGYHVTLPGQATIADHRRRGV